jgi:uncharacterized caspase-like protein
MSQTLQHQEVRRQASRAWLAIVASACALQAAFALAAPLPADAPARHALVIGHSRYAEVSSLPNVAHDLSDMCAGLKQLRFSTTCLADLPDRNSLLKAVDSFVASVPAGASVVMYYAGHAVQVAGENYLIPTGVSASDPRGWLPQFVRLSELFQSTERARAGFQFIVLDACRDNPESPKPSARNRVAEAAKGAHPTGRDTLRSLLGAVRRSAGIASYGIAAVRDAPANTLVLFATGAGTSAFDGDGERNGPLTKQLLVEMHRPQMQVDQAVKKIIQAVGDDTERRYRQRQSPSVYGTFAGEFCFNGCPVSMEQMQQEQARAAREARERLEREQRERRDSVVVPTL